MSSDAERAIRAVLREIDAEVDTQVQAEWEGAIEREDEAFAWQSLAKLSSIRMPRLPSIRVPRLPSVRVPRLPSPRLPSGRLPRSTGGRSAPGRTASGRSRSGRSTSTRPARRRSGGSGRSPGSRPARRTFRSEVAAGFRPQHLPHLRRLLGQPLTSPANKRLESIWRRSANPGEAAALRKGNSRAMFNLHRRRFWTAVRRDPAARRMFTRRGLHVRAPGVGSLPDAGRRPKDDRDHGPHRGAAVCSPACVEPGQPPALPTAREHRPAAPAHPTQQAIPRRLRNSRSSPTSRTPRRCSDATAPPDPAHARNSLRSGRLGR